MPGPSLFPVFASQQFNQPDGSAELTALEVRGVTRISCGCFAMGAKGRRLGAAADDQVSVRLLVTPEEDS